jgi:3-dehydroquinate synthase class II
MCSQNRSLYMQVLVEAETQDGQRHSILLQNAETVRLIGPRMAMSSVSNMEDISGPSQTSVQSEVSVSQQSQSDAVSVSELQIGQPVYLHLQGAARHTGISIHENCGKVMSCILHSHNHLFERNIGHR